MMKSKVFSLILGLLLTGSVTVFAQSKTESFEVKGNCGMCKDRIEKAVKSVGGVTAADWNKDTKMLTVSYESSKMTKDRIQQAIAKVGHDTGQYKAEDTVYNNLPGCCKYDRAPAKTEIKCSHSGKTSCCGSKGKSSCK